ncbi:MAG: sodium/proline symporter PutP [Clostridia bacterium]|nr:sodium/proline symporter PutP [Clostridia bacterium]
MFLEGNKLIYFIVLAVYLILMVLVGLRFYRRNKNVSDYVLGGRTLNPWVAAMSAQASDMSGWLLLGLPGTAYVLFAGTTEAIWTAIGLAVGTYLNWLIVAKPLRRYTAKVGAITLPEFFANRFGDKRGVIKAIASIFTMIFFLFYTASMFSAGAKLFNSVFGIPYIWSLIIGTVIIVSYTFLGGFLAVSWTDTFQGILMFLALIVAPIVAFIRLGGGAGLSAQLATLPEQFSLIPKDGAGAVNVALLVSAIAWGLGYFGQPHILPRFMAVKRTKDIRPARVIAMIWVIISLAMAVVVGLLGSFLYPGLADSETVFITMVQDLFSPVITGVLLSAILAAIMSTADSQLLVTSSAVSNDLYKGLFKKDASDKKVLWVSRVAVIIVSVIAALLVCVENPAEGSILAKINESVFKLVAFAWAGFGAAFGPLVLFSLFWKRTTKAGALCGMIAGGVSAFIWWYLEGGIFDIYEILPGFVISCIVIVVVSLITKNPPEIEKTFKEVKAMKD